MQGTSEMTRREDKNNDGQDRASEEMPHARTSKGTQIMLGSAVYPHKPEKRVIACAEDTILEGHEDHLQT